MVPSQRFPSTQSFYHDEVATLIESDNAGSEPPHSGNDGFTEEELADSLDSLNRRWNPEREYQELTIQELVPGPLAVSFIGRIVNLSTVFGQSQKQPKAAGWHYVVVKDDTAAISVKIYFSRNPYPFRLGACATIWTTFISDSSSKAGNIATPSVLVYANIFPGRVTSDHIMIHTSTSTENICRLPLLYQKTRALPGLTTLSSYLSGGHDGVPGIRLLVCVKSIGPRKTIVRKSGGECELVDVILLDHTAQIKLTVWRDLIESAKEWQAGQTILLITNPIFKVGYGRKGSIGIQSSTFVDVDPDYPDSHWLLNFVNGLLKKESVRQDFPEDIWDVDAAEHGANVLLFTLADIDEWVRSDPRQIFTGHINVTFMELALVLHYRRKMLFCSEWSSPSLYSNLFLPANIFSCGIALYSSVMKILCPNCNKLQGLSLNPNIIGTLMDETGSIAPGKLLWSERAWEQLFGRGIKEISEMTGEEIRLFEQRLAFMRMHLVFGWEQNVGKLAVLGVRQ